MSDNASPTLADIRRKMKQQASRIREKLDGIIRSQTYQKCLQDAIVTQRNGRFVVPVKAEFRGQIAGLVHDTSSSGATVFVEPMAVVEANNEIRVLQSKEREEIERYLEETGQAFCTDSTNADTEYTRNKIRHELLPCAEGDEPPLRPHAVSGSGGVRQKRHARSGADQRCYRRLPR